MTIVANIDLARLAHELGLPLDVVQRTLALLDDGNTIPFITRFRKDATGGLNEEQLVRLQRSAAKERMLAERKATILRTIESQGRLTEELANQIKSARTLKWLEDIYLPFKPKKQTLATAARQRGLEPLAARILAADPAITDLAVLAAELVNPEKGLGSAEDVLSGVRHILAEQFSERPDVRGKLRRIMRRNGVLTCDRVESSGRPETTASASESPSSSVEPDFAADEERRHDQAESSELGAETELSAPAAREQDLMPDEVLNGPELSSDAAAEDESDGHAAADTAFSGDLSLGSSANTSDSVPSDSVPSDSVPSDSVPSDSVPSASVISASGVSDSGTAKAGTLPGPHSSPEKKSSVPAAPGPLAKRRLSRKQAAKERKRRLFEHAFKDYYNFRESISRLPPHRVLAINRGERAKVLRVRLECPGDELLNEAVRLFLPDQHPHAAFLRECIVDGLHRLIVPSLEREIRRELTEEAEEHAVNVFVGNLRKLLLQAPVRGKRVLAIDPAFRSGCKIVALDEFGQILEHGTVFVIGTEEQRASARVALADLVRRNRIGLIAIGNGAACRETEQFVSDVLANELREHLLAYVIVNEAGASVYSTSQIGREELPDCDAVMRSAVSIGRRLLDPLSELVKINPANIGVGMYQHDVKAKHLRESLDAVVNSCVNFVGVDVNTASPALLSYVSGLNQLTARRLYEYRLEHGPFRTREQLKNVPGIGEATYVQAAGFLKIMHGDNPLDATSIHPESYEAVCRVLKKLDIELDELRSVSGNCSAPPAAVDTSPAPATKIAVQDEPTRLAAGHSDPSSLQTAGPEAAGPEAAGPEAAGPEAAGPEAAAPAAAAPAAAAPEAAAPVAAAPEAAALEAVAPETVAPDAVAPDAVAPDAGTNSAGLAASDSVASDAVTPATMTLNVETSGAVNSETEDSRAAVSRGGASNTNPAAYAATGSRVDGTMGDGFFKAPVIPTVSLADRLTNVDIAALSRELNIGELTLRDIVAALAPTERDPRDKFQPPPFRTGIMKLDDLKPGMELQGTVLNVVDFGAFVDIGISDSALIHISKLADRYVRDPQEVVGVGDVLKVWVIAVDRERRRVSLTAIDPHAPMRPRPRREERRPRRAKPAPVVAEARAAKAPSGPTSTVRTVRHPPRKQPPKPFQKRAQKPQKPKPVRPITSAMLTGKQPMRSFSDLLQFYEKKKTDDNGSPPQS